MMTYDFCPPHQLWSFRYFGHGEEMVLSLIRWILGSFGKTFPPSSIIFDDFFSLCGNQFASLMAKLLKLQSVSIILTSWMTIDVVSCIYMTSDKAIFYFKLHSHPAQNKNKKIKLTQRNHNLQKFPEILNLIIIKINKGRQQHFIKSYQESIVVFGKFPPLCHRNLNTYK